MRNRQTSPSPPNNLELTKIIDYDMRKASFLLSSSTKNMDVAGESRVLLLEYKFPPPTFLYFFQKLWEEDLLVFSSSNSSPCGGSKTAGHPALGSYPIYLNPLTKLRKELQH